jgi:SnoaL-like domain
MRAVDVAIEFAEAVAAKDAERLAALFAPGVDFRALTPNQNWQASGAAEIVEIVFGSWFEPKDEIDELVSVETGSIADRDWFAFRLRGHNPDGPFEVEQNAYLSTGGGTIEWMRVLCSGFRPAR